MVTEAPSWYYRWNLQVVASCGKNWMQKDLGYNLNPLRRSLGRSVGRADGAYKKVISSYMNLNTNLWLITHTDVNSNMGVLVMNWHWPFIGGVAVEKTTKDKCIFHVGACCEEFMLIRRRHSHIPANPKDMSLYFIAFIHFHKTHSHCIAGIANAKMGGVQ